jgi:hypothetical protein
MSRVVLGPYSGAKAARRMGITDLLGREGRPINPREME